MADGTGIILLLMAALTLHLVEQIRTGFRDQLPLGAMPLPAFVGINVAAYTLCFATLIASVRRGELATPFTWLFAIAMSANGLGYVAVVVARRRYVPGAVTAVFVLILAGCLVLRLLGAI